MREADPATAKDASSMTHQFAVEMGQKMMASAIKNNLNVVVDGTLSNPEQATKQIAALKGEHYKIEVKALAVQREVSVSRTNISRSVSMRFQCKRL